MPNKMNKEFETELAFIIEARKAAYKPTLLLLVLIAAGFVVEYYFASIGALFGIAAFVIFYKRLSAAAHLPCPKCSEPFGSATKLPLGVGSESCQNCGLNLYENKA
jgi:hypothetical protein